MADLAKRPEMAPAAVSCAVKGGEITAKEADYHLEN